jgi:hypothetical protein
MLVIFKALNECKVIREIRVTNDHREINDLNE